MRRLIAGLVLCLALSGCQWRGLNSLTLPGTTGGGEGSYTIQAQLPDVVTIQENSRVRVADLNVGNVTRIEVQDWHALVTMRINGDVQLPANSTAKVGQTSLLGSMHVELAPPADEPPEGRLPEGSLIPLSRAGMYPTTEQTLAAISLLLNGGGVGQVQDITTAFSTAFSGREADLRSLIEQLDLFIAYNNDQKDDIIAAGTEAGMMLRNRWISGAIDVPAKMSEVSIRSDLPPPLLCPHRSFLLRHGVIKCVRCILVSVTSVDAKLHELLSVTRQWR